MTENSKTSTQPDYDQAINHALDRLRKELPPNLTYHSAWHTEFDVLPAARYLGKLAGLEQHEQGLLEIAAAYHDIGHIYISLGHEDVSVEIMSEVMPRFGFSSQDIDRLTALIMATRMPQSPKNRLEQLLADADMDGLGRNDFLDTSTALWRENTALGRPQSWEQWLHTQLKFLNSHHYHTNEAQSLREDGKQHNIRMLEELIRETHAQQKI